MPTKRVASGFCVPCSMTNCSVKHIVRVTEHLTHFCQLKFFSHLIMLVRDLTMIFGYDDISSPVSNLRYPRWLPKWPPRTLNGYNFINITHRVILVSNSMLLGSRNSYVSSHFYLEIKMAAKFQYGCQNGGREH